MFSTVFFKASFHSTLPALAALAAVSAASAQSTVTISGLLDLGMRSVNAPGSTSDTRGAIGTGGSATTGIFIQGSEDLGGGMKANFRYEINPDLFGGTGFVGNVATVTEGATAPVGGGAVTGATNTSVATSANGYHFVGLSTRMGEIKLGRLNTGTLSAWGTASVFGTALGSGYGSANQYTRYATAAGGTHLTAPTRFNNAVEYTTPSFSGLTGRLLFVPQVNNATTNTASTVNRAGVTDISVAYVAGPLSVNAAQQQVKVGSNGVDFTQIPAGAAATTDGVASTNKLTTLAAGYTIGAGRIQGGYWTEKNGTAVNTQGYILGGRYAIGATTLMASMAKSNDKLVANVDRQIFGLGADYSLSKRTALWARYETRDANTVSAADDKTKTMAAGVRHTF